MIEEKADSRYVGITSTQQTLDIKPYISEGELIDKLFWKVWRCPRRSETEKNFTLINLTEIKFRWN